ncbi:MAG: cbb3-type cytochrome oxidase assembly protein CcoS [Pacificimonas sp.]|nr:cbb3-type cytochrome oxidase assembly protein CcoS [Pacificimonas sp.]
MNGLALLIPVALGLGIGALFAFFWALRRDQFDDLDGAALRVLIDDEDDEITTVASAAPHQRAGD